MPYGIKIEEFAIREMFCKVERNQKVADTMKLNMEMNNAESEQNGHRKGTKEDTAAGGQQTTSILVNDNDNSTDNSTDPAASELKKGDKIDNSTDNFTDPTASELKKGDKIGYFDLIAVHGDPYKYKYATIVGMDAKNKKYPLILNTMDLIPMDYTFDIPPLVRETNYVKGKFGMVRKTELVNRNNSRSVLLRNCKYPLKNFGVQSIAEKGAGLANLTKKCKETRDSIEKAACDILTGKIEWPVKSKSKTR